MRREPNLRYKRNQKELRGRKKDKASKKVTENAVRRQNRVDHNQEFD